MLWDFDCGTLPPPAPKMACELFARISSAHTMRGAVAAAAAAEEEAAGMDTLPVVVALRKEMVQLKETVAQLREEMDFKVSQLRAELRGARLAPDGKVVQTYESALKKRRILQAKPSEIEKDELSRLQDYVLLRLYQEIPSRNDFADVKIISKIEYNAIIMSVDALGITTASPTALKG
jgi:hypothetical protein